MRSLCLFCLLLGLASCYPTEKLSEPIKEDEEPQTELDKHIDTNFTQKYGMSIRYKFSDNYIQPDQRVTPTQLEVVRPMLDFIQKFWIDPYSEIPNGEQFFKEHVPSEIVLLGGLIFKTDGTVVLGLADAGSRITFTNVNALDESDKDWQALQLQTVYHEFAHTVHQLYKLPTAFETIAPAGYTGPGSWYVLTEDQALQRGFVSPYATSSPNEDFAETVSGYLFNKDFEKWFVDQDSTCTTDECITRNEGRAKIAAKLEAIKSHYKKVTGVDLDELRKAIQSKL